MAAFDFPNSPSNGDTYSANGIDWIYNGSVWKKDATSGVKGQKGEVGDKGQKGEVGEKGQKGEVGDKGQKGEIGATGGTGGTGDKGQKGQKGEVGDKGQKGEIGATGGTGGTGSKGDKGQKGQDGTDATGAKGQKGEKGAIGPQGGTGGTGDKGDQGQKGDAGAAASKGQKGDTGAQGPGGSSGSDGSDGNKGQKGDDNSTKGQKGDTGAQGDDYEFPSGTRMLFQQTSAPTGWTKDTSSTNRALRLVSGTVGTGGANTFTGKLNSTVSTSGGSVSNHTLTTAQLATHYHNLWTRNEIAIDGSRGSTSNSGQAGGNWNRYVGYRQVHGSSDSYTPTSENTGSNSAHNHGFTNPNFNLNIAYTDVIIAQKN